MTYFVITNPTKLRRLETRTLPFSQLVTEVCGTWTFLSLTLLAKKNVGNGILREKSPTHSCVNLFQNGAVHVGAVVVVVAAAVIQTRLVV